MPVHGLVWTCETKPPLQRLNKEEGSYPSAQTTGQLLYQRQAPEHYKCPSNLQMFTYVFMVDALGYKS